jgi:arginine exporter protein ArgO
MKPTLKNQVTALALALVATPAFAETNLDVGSTGISGFDNLINIAIRILQVVFLLGGFAYLGFAGLAKAKGEMDANDRISNAGVGAAIAIGAPILLEVIKRAMGV